MPDIATFRATPKAMGDDSCSVCGVKLWDGRRQKETLAGSNTCYSDLCSKHCVEHLNGPVRVNQRWDAEWRERQQKTMPQITLGYCNDCKSEIAVEYGLWADDGQAQVQCLRCEGHNARIA